MPKAPIVSLSIRNNRGEGGGLGGFVVGESLKKVGNPLPSDLKMMPLLLSVPRPTIFYVFSRASK